ncbi:hypothetical protein D9611_006538 [Ephemerocybe angulata]|uniref:Mitochondrial carrier n=1 Tax=Ephemerocybe angulata TaxID=980116 RepID=A0A8H5C760_9AGAR|nr:hypothetical protein D9611_006538 [Tulosesus angulatus]
MAIDSSSKDVIALENIPESLATHHNICGNGHTLKAREVDVEEPAPFRDAAKEIVIGSLAGMVSEVFEYPFDLAKVRLQAQLLSPNSGSTAPKFSGPLDCLMQTWKQEGVAGMYRGMAAPIAGSMAVTAALFLSYSSFQNLFRNFGPIRSDPNEPLPFSQLGISAAGAGAVASFVLTPIELVKCKMQVQMMNFPLNKPQSVPSVPGRIPHRSPPLAAWPSSTSEPRTSTPKSPPSRAGFHDAAASYKVKALPAGPPGPIALIRSIVETHGYRGLWLGHTGTMFRETGGCAAWFIVKEYVAKALVERRMAKYPGRATKKDMQPLAWESAVSGAMAGAAGALILYPADTVKSAIQTADEMRTPSLGREGSVAAGAARKPKVGVGFWGTAMKMYKVHGVKGLYAGCGMTVGRAIPSSGIIFVVYDGLNNWFA